MYNVLVILVHRLLLSDTTLSSGPITTQALATSWKASYEIAHILRLHKSLYKPLSETFSLCYAAYIGATFYIHMTKRFGDHFGAADSLHIYLDCLDRHQTLYSAAKRARSILEKLMVRCQVRLCVCGGLAGYCQCTATGGVEEGSVSADSRSMGDQLGVTGFGTSDPLALCFPDPHTLTFDMDSIFSLHEAMRLEVTNNNGLPILDLPFQGDLYYPASSLDGVADSSVSPANLFR